MPSSWNDAVWILLGTRRHIPEDAILHSLRRENLKSYIPALRGIGSYEPSVWAYEDRRYYTRIA
jgi:hypothetical protein